MKIIFTLFTFILSSIAYSQAPTIQWQKSFGSNAYDFAYKIIQTTDGGYIIAGTDSANGGNVTGNHGGYDFWVVKLNSTGTIQWQKSLGGSGDDEANSIIQTTDGGYAVSGFSTSNDGDVSGNHGNSDFWIVKLNSTGTIQWQKTLGGSDDDYSFFSTIQTPDGGYTIAGFTTSTDGDVTGNHGGGDAWVVKLNSSGTVQWQNALGGSKED